MATTAESIELVTPLGEDLLFQSMHSQDQLSRLSRYDLELVSKKKDIDRNQVLGAKVTVKVMLENEKVRYYNGIVTRFSAGGTSLGKYRRYHAVVHPWLWFLTRSADCRIFQGKNVREIVEEVLEDYQGLADYVFEITENYRKWDYCVQYRETDFNFVSRMLEHEGIYYYFRHTEGHDTLVFTDSMLKHDPFPGYETLQFVPPELAVRPGTEHVSAWRISREVQPSLFVHDDYDFTKPGVELETKQVTPETAKTTDYRMEVFDYPGFYMQKPDGQHYASVRMNEFASQVESAVAETNYRGICVGSRFTLEGHEIDTVNGDYLVTAATQVLQSTQYEAGVESGGAEYRCSFTALSTAQQFRPRRTTPKPFVQGPQTAVVVGPAGDEIHTDKYGRVKVQFHWDRRGRKDEKSSCWIRVSHPWAGKGWGSVATPRIGQEVIVDFLEGDPDQPIITGRVYNEDNQPPFGFPAGAVISGVKSDTHKGGGYNEMSLDDTAGKERVFIHGQYNMDTVVEHDQTTTVHNCRTDVIDVDDSETVGRDQTIHIQANQKINVDVNRTETVGANETITVHGHRSEKVNNGEDVTVVVSRIHTVNGFQSTTISAAENHTVGAARTHEVGAIESITVGGPQIVQIGAVQSVDIGGAQILNVKGAQNVKIGADQNVDVKTANNLKIGGDQTVKVDGGRAADIGKSDSIKAGKNFIVEAGDSITIKTGDASIIMKKDGTITIKGKNITIKGSGKINVKADSDVVVKGSKVGIN